MPIEWKESALSDLERLPITFQKAIAKRIQLAEQNPDHYLALLVGKPCYKLRVGDYRVFLDWEKPNKLFILRIFHRKVAYKR